MIGLAEPWTAPAQQRLFRALLTATARPGEVRQLAPWLGGERADIGVLATLVDAATTWHDRDALARSARALLGAPHVDAAAAAFVLADGARAPDGLAPRLGEPTAPELGATLLLRVAALGERAPGGALVALRGPGIDGERRLRVAGLDGAWLAARERWNAAPPCGVDLLLCDATAIAAIPRSSAARWEG